MRIKTMAEYTSEGITPEVLFWVGCAGSFDDRAKRITKAFCQILQHIGVSFAILGKEEKCTGDPARRAGNEYLFQMMALENIATLEAYQVRKIVTACPHCYNTIKNEYPALGGVYEVVHHTQFLHELMKSGRLKIEGGAFQGKKITFQDPCYLGRINGEYEAPRELLRKLDSELVEMRYCKAKGLCCGAGGGQFFKESEKGSKEINIHRTAEALETQSDIVVTGCPFCSTMLRDGIAQLNKSKEIIQKDIAELIAEAKGLGKD